MEIIIYTFMFIIGTLLGSFYTLAVYRIPLKQDITHTRSYCPKCNHRLNFWDLIPVLSYLFLGGKCRYCNDKIRPRYLVLELLSGIAFLLFSISLNINILEIDYVKIATLIYGTMFFSTIFITIGIYKEHKRIEKSVFNFGIISSFIYIVYLYILNRSIYRYIIYISALIIIVFLFNNKKTTRLMQKICLIIYILLSIFQITSIIL